MYQTRRSGWSERDDNVAGYVYLMRSGRERLKGHYKIGLTRNLDRRLAELNSSQAVEKIVKVHAIQVDRMLEVEQMLHRKYKTRRGNGEWFSFWLWEVGGVVAEMNRIERVQRNKDLQWQNSIYLLLVGMCGGLVMAMFLEPPKAKMIPTRLEGQCYQMWVK